MLLIPRQWEWQWQWERERELEWPYKCDWELRWYTRVSRLDSRVCLSYVYIMYINWDFAPSLFCSVMYGGIRRLQMREIFCVSIYIYWVWALSSPFLFVLFFLFSLFFFLPLSFGLMTSLASFWEAPDEELHLNTWRKNNACTNVQI